MTRGGRKQCIFVVVLTTTACCCLAFTKKIALVTPVSSICCDRIAAIPVPSSVVSVGATGKNLGEDVLTDNLSSASSSTFPTSTSTPDKRMPMPVTVWGGEHSQDARIAARLVSDAVKLCLEYQNHLTNKVNTDGNYTTNNTTLDKTDGTPVTVLDFAIQGYIISSLKKHEEARHQNNMSNNSITVSFLAEEDVDDLRNDKNHKYLSQSALNLARSLDPNLTMEDFLDALDDDPSRGGKSPTHTHHHHQPHRSWILDPIDGTRGLLQGKQYAIGLAMCLDGRVVVGVLGNPSVTTPSHDSSSSPVMVAVKGHGLRYYDRKCGGNEEDEFLDPPRKIPGSWHTQDYDLESLLDASYSYSPSPLKCPKEVGKHYPPYLLSMGPKSTDETSIRFPKQQPPFPFGPLCPPTELCCGSLVKYYAIASGQAAGFLQLSQKVSGYVNSWDHAPGMLCVEESGGSVIVVEEEDKYNAGVGKDGAAVSIGESLFSETLPLFDRPQFPIHHGIVCFSREASGSMKKRLLESVLEK